MKISLQNWLFTSNCYTCIYFTILNWQSPLQQEADLQQQEETNNKKPQIPGKKAAVLQKCLCPPPDSMAKWAWLLTVPQGIACLDLGHYANKLNCKNWYGMLWPLLWSKRDQRCCVSEIHNLTVIGGYFTHNWFLFSRSPLDLLKYCRI